MTHLHYCHYSLLFAASLQNKLIGLLVTRRRGRCVVVIQTENYDGLLCALNQTINDSSTIPEIKSF